MLGLWTGYAPNLLRNCVVNATELVAYDQSKQFYLHTLRMSDGVLTHFASALTAGLAATLLGSPVDVVKTRVMNAKKVQGSIPLGAWCFWILNGPADEVGSILIRRCGCVQGV